MTEKKNKKSKDPFHRDNIEKTLDDRIDQADKVKNTLATHAAVVQKNIAEILPSDKHGQPLYSALNRRSDNYDPEVERKAKEIVKKSIDPNSAEYSPLKGRLKDLRDHEKDLISALYFPEERELKEALNRDDWVDELINLLGRKKLNVERTLKSRATYGFDRDEHGEHVVEYLQKKFNLNDKEKGYLEKGRMATESEEVLTRYLVGDIDSKSDLLNLYGNKRPAKKKKDKK